MTERYKGSTFELTIEEMVGSDFAEDNSGLWEVSFPHQRDDWSITAPYQGDSYEVAMQRLVAFRDEVDEAIRVLEGLRPNE